MDKGYIENGFIVDVSNANKTSEIIYELSNVLDLPDAQCKKVCLKLGGIDLNSSQLTSIKALVESMNSELEFISTTSEQTKESADSLGVSIKEFENKIPMPEFNAEDDTINAELEKALDKIFGDNPEELESNVFNQGYRTIETEDYLYEELEEEKTVSEDENSEVNNESEQIENIIEEEISLEDIKEYTKETEKLPTLYIQRTIRSGQSITSKGNMVIIGDVHPGSEIIAAGDITIWGILGGIAHAGSEGNKFAKIRALKMNAIQLRIADVFARRPDNINIPYIQKTDTFVPEEASVRKKQIIIRKIHEGVNI